MWTTAAAALLLAALAAAPARAGSEIVQAPWTPALVPAAVRVAGVHVGGMTPDMARLALRDEFRRPLTFAVDKRRWRIRPGRVDARADLRGAIAQALAAFPLEDVRLPVSVERRSVRSYVAHMDRRFSRAPVDARLQVRGIRPVVMRPIPGRDLARLTMRVLIERSLREQDRRPIKLRFHRREPKVTKVGRIPVVVIARDSKRLLLYRGTRLQATFPIATGQPSYPTPVGSFSIVIKERDPWWNPPDSDWARGLKPVPPGPGNPLGTRWMGLSARGIGVHGTPDAASIGYSASHGCIRMHVPQAEWLFEHVSVGTPVFIVAA
jgi:lipoprotein-anchoring transpeptidase ErfK/SrfK